MPLHPPITSSALVLWLCAAAPAAAGGVPGAFDFYVLSLSWSPTYCATDDRPDPAQCDKAGQGFVVHGLWPQYEQGYPAYCDSALPDDLDRAAMATALAVMPSAGLAGHQWRKHGLCTGLAAPAYFTLTAQTAAVVAVPPTLAGRHSPARLSPTDIEAAFAAANPGLSRNAMAVTCRDGMFNEIRVCMTRDLAFRACVEVDADSCRLPAVALPPVH